MLADVVAHADWSVDHRKRWACVARRRGDQLVAETLEPVATLATLVDGVAAAPSVVIGVDTPIGLPRAYARAAAIDRFLPWLRGLPANDLARWSLAATSPDDIALTRPFYPQRPGGASRAHLVDGLGLASFDDLLRACDRSPPQARPAASLFWTLGANQVGKAAVALWTELARLPAVRVWPFEGALEVLAGEGGVVVAEAYPAAFGAHLGVAWRAGESKRRRSDRLGHAPALARTASELGVELAPPVRAALLDGFGVAATGEDAYDAVIGLLGVVNVLRGRRPAGPPPEVLDATTVEGWILGVG